MADSIHLDKDRDEDRDGENACKDLSAALAKNQASYSKCHASYSSTESGHEYYCILGPYYFKEVPEAIQMAVQGAQHPNVAPYACTKASASWQKQSRKAYGWLLSSKSEWPQWVNRLKTTSYADHWKRAGIYDAILMSTSSIAFDSSLVAAGLCFWNSATNTMDLPGLGMMSPTLLDVAAITGFRPHGKEVSALTIPHHRKLILDVVDRCCYSNFMESFKGKEEQEVTMVEHIAFLLYWLCKYVFSVASGRIVKEWAGLAEALASSDNIALGPLVLAHLYRSLHRMVQEKMNAKASGPIWLFQMWLQLYFPELAPPLVSYHQDQLLGASLVGAAAADHTLEKCFSTLRQCNSRTVKQWSVCLNRTYPSFLQLFGPSSSNSMESVDVSTSILTTRDLHFGVKKNSGTGYHMKHCGAELYCPNHFSRQLGCLQCIPVPLVSSVNLYSSWRRKFEKEGQVKELSKSLESIRREFKHRQYTKSFVSTKIFQRWWENKMVTVSSVDCKHMFGEPCLHCSFKKSIPEEADRDHNTVATASVHQSRQRAYTGHPSSSSVSVLPAKRTQFNRTQAFDVIILEDEEDEEEEKEDEMPVATFLSKKYKRQETQDIPTGFEQVKSESQNQPSTTGIPPLRGQIREMSTAASPSGLSQMESFDWIETVRKTVLTFMDTSLSSGVDMEGFDRFKVSLQVLIDLGDVSSNDTPILQSRLQELEAHLPDFRDVQREIRDVDEGLALLPVENAASKMKTSVEQYSKIDDMVKKLDSRLAELEAEIALVRTKRDQAVGALKLELDTMAPNQPILDRARELEERKSQLAMKKITISEQYETTMKELKGQLGLDKVPTNICNRVTDKI